MKRGILSVLLSLIVGLSYGQIDFYNYNPPLEETQSPGNFSGGFLGEYDQLKWDADQNGLMDIYIRVKNFQHGNWNVQMYTEESLNYDVASSTVSGSGADLATMFKAGDMIDGSLDWEDIEDMTIDDYHVNRELIAQLNESYFYGFRVYNSSIGGYQYGWIKVVVNYEAGSGDLNVKLHSIGFDKSGNGLKADDNGWPLGVESVYRTKQLELYPNPTSDKVYFKSPTTYRLMNISGQEVLRGNNDLELNLEGLNPGIYFIQAEGYEVTKLVVR